MLRRTSLSCRIDRISYLSAHTHSFQSWAGGRALFGTLIHCAKRICELGWDFYWSCYGKNWQNGGYISLLAEKCSQNKYRKVYIFAKLRISASRKYILLYTYFRRLFSMYTYISLILPILALARPVEIPTWLTYSLKLF